MSIFKFDDTKEFAVNIEAFLTLLSEDDPEMAAILRTHISKLSDINDDTQRRIIRANFNASVKADLDTLLNSTEKRLEE